MATKNNKGKMSVQEAGRKGGQSTSKKHGRKFYHEIGTKGGRRVRELIQNAKESEAEKTTEA